MLSGAVRPVQVEGQSNRPARGRAARRLDELGDLGMLPVIVGLVLCGVAMALTAVGVNLGPVAMSPVPLADVLEQGAWFPLVLLAAVPLGCLPRTIVSVKTHKPYELLRE